MFKSCTNCKNGTMLINRVGEAIILCMAAKQYIPIETIGNEVICDFWRPDDDDLHAYGGLVRAKQENDQSLSNKE